MFEKVNPSHPDKIADRIAGAIVDLAYTKEKDPRIAVEVLIGHGHCNTIIESSVIISRDEVIKIVSRITGRKYKHSIVQAEQDCELADNQKGKMKCGDNGIFRGVPITYEQRELGRIAREIYARCPYDGKYLMDGGRLIICQSNAATEEICAPRNAEINPLGFWTGGTDVDTGATNRKLGSDMGDAATGGGLHGKDLNKADVALNIYAHMTAQAFGRAVELSCAIGDEYVVDENGKLKEYGYYAEMAREYITNLGGFEKLAEWGLI